MAAIGRRAGGFLGPIQRVFGRGTVSGLSEGQLLAQFVGERDEVAFEAIVSRHGPMVLGICRRLLNDPHDVEDAFQATFLVLVRRAGELRDRDLLASWLYGVALRVATRCRRDRGRRRAREAGGERVDVAIQEPDDSGLGELRGVIDAEVARLPERFRAPIVLCYFEGMTHDQAAERLGCPVGTVRSRMSKGRELLRSRLARRGFGPEAMPAPGSVAMAAIGPPVPPDILARTVNAAAGAAIGRSIVSAGASAPAARLARGVLRAMTISRWTTIAAACAVLGALGGGVGVMARQDRAGNKAAPTSKAEAQEQKAPASVPPSSPALKTLEEMQTWIKQWDAILAEKQKVIDQQQTEIANLKAQIAEFKGGEGKAESPRPAPASATAAVPNTEPSPDQPATDGAPAAKAEEGTEPIMADQILTGPSSIVSISGASDRVVVFSKTLERSRTYQPPRRMKTIDVTFHGDNVTVIASEDEHIHLVNYNVRTDHWDIQDIRGVKEGGAFMLEGRNGHGLPGMLEGVPGGEEHLLPCVFRGSGVTQVAILDLDRGAWTVQNLDEPSEQLIAPEINGKLVAYAVGKRVYAYSGEAGRWDTLTLEQPLFANQGSGGLGNGRPFLIQDQMIAVSQQGRLHVFTAREGKWRTINPRD
ncbi:MAG: RNA polymerase sigma factor [Isosphaeraceae bacterium]